MKVSITRGVVAPIWLAVVLVVAAPAVAVGHERPGSLEKGPPLLGYFALDTTPVNCLDSDAPWSCAENAWRAQRGWYAEESLRLRDLASNLSWATALAAGCLVVVDDRAGETTARACTFASLAPLVYDDLTVSRYRKRLADNGVDLLDSMHGRYAPLKEYVGTLRTAERALTGGVDCGPVASDLAMIKRLPVDATTRIVDRDLTALLAACDAHNALAEALAEGGLRLASDKVLAQRILDRYALASGDIYAAYTDTAPSPSETFSTVIAAPFSAISRALKDNTGLQDYSSKRSRSPDVFSFDFAPIVDLPETLAPLPAGVPPAGLSEEGDAAVTQIAAGAKALAAAKLKKADVEAVRGQAFATSRLLQARRGDARKGRAALEAIMKIVGPYKVTVDLRPSPVEGATTAKKPAETPPDAPVSAGQPAQ
jgi:hypothetical protein